jgi:hypothetical protein
LFQSKEFKRTGALLSQNLKALVLSGWLIYLVGVLSTTWLYLLEMVGFFEIDFLWF